MGIAGATCEAVVSEVVGHPPGLAAGIIDPPDLKAVLKLLASAHDQAASVSGPGNGAIGLPGFGRQHALTSTGGFNGHDAECFRGIERRVAAKAGDRAAVGGPGDAVRREVGGAPAHGNGTRRISIETGHGYGCLAAYGIDA